MSDRRPGALDAIRFGHTNQGGRFVCPNLIVSKIVVEWIKIVSYRVCQLNLQQQQQAGSNFRILTRRPKYPIPPLRTGRSLTSRIYPHSHLSILPIIFIDVARHASHHATSSLRRSPFFLWKKYERQALYFRDIYDIPPWQTLRLFDLSQLPTYASQNCAR